MTMMNKPAQPTEYPPPDYIQIFRESFPEITTAAIRGAWRHRATAAEYRATLEQDARKRLGTAPEGARAA